ncbi:Protoheme IX farnesyltransferase [Mactra antiquata]
MAPGYSMTQGKGQDQNKERPTLPEKAQTGSKVSVSKTDQNQSSEGREKEPLERTSSFEHRRQSSFMLAVTKQKNKEESIYAVPHNNTKVMNAQKDISQGDIRHGYMKQNSTGSMLADIPDGPEDPESYNYTLSNSDQYRRPGLNVSEPNHRMAVTQNFSRGNETQRKDSFKKGKGKVPADVIRYHVDGSRRSSQSSESDTSSPVHEPQNIPPVSSSKPALPMKPKNMQMRSVSVDDNKVDNNKLSHKVIKPMASGLPGYENGDGVTRAHTPVQSGLATLPRNKKSSNNSSSNMASSSSTTMSHSQSRTGSQHMSANQQYHEELPPPPYSSQPNHQVVTGYQSCLTYQNVIDSEMHSRQSSNSSILSTGTVVECPVGDGSHNRQMSTASQDTLTDKPKEVKSKSKKKDKEEKKRDESRQRKEEKKGKSKKEKGSKSDKPPQVPDKKGGNLPDEGFSEEKYYIDRRMVESVLSAQKLQRSGSCVSNSSMESADSYNRTKGVTPKDNLSSEIPFDAASLDSHKDSGYASSDRNSSSSTGSITMNPYEQYFLSRSMIPPKTINQQAAEHMRKLMDQGAGVNGLEYTQEKDLKSLVTNPNEYYNQNYTLGHVTNGLTNHKSPPVLPSKDLALMSKSERDQHLFDALSGRSKNVQPPQVPNKTQSGQVYGGPGFNQGHNGLSQQQQPPQQTDCYGQTFQHVASRNIESTTKQSYHEGLQGDNEQFMNLCQKAEDFMDSCVLAETSEQYSQALGFCQQAIDLLKNAMRMPSLSQSLYTMAQKKSNSCVIKFRSLQKRLISRQESNTSSNSSDSGITQDYRSQQKGASHLQVPHNGVKPPSRSSSQNSIDSHGSCRSSTPVFDKVTRPSTEERVPSMEPHMPEAIYQNSHRDRSFENNLPNSNMNNADLYGTLPRRKTQKSQEHLRQSGSQQHEAEVYNDFLENQRRQSGNHSRTSSGARTPVNEIDFPVNYNMNSELSYHNGDRSHFSANSALQTGYRSGIKPIPVTPPKIENQSHQTEVGYQSNSWELPVSTRQPIGYQPTNRTRVPGFTTPWNASGAFHGDLNNSPPVARLNLYGSLPSHVRNGNKACRTHNVSSGTVQTAFSTQLHTTFANLCEPVTTEACDSGYSHNTLNGSKLPKKGRQLDRSASFTYLTRPSSFTCVQKKSKQDVSHFPSSYHLIDSKYYGKSQPDLRKLSEESVNVPQRPLTPQVLCPEPNESEEDRQVSVKALTSRFETVNVISENKNEDSRTRSVHGNNFNVHPHLTHNTSVPSNIQHPSHVPFQRQRSKSESESIAQQPQRPKSVLSKKCRNSDRMKKPRKSVTFSDNVCLVAAANDFGIMGNPVTQSGYQSDGEGHNRDIMSRISSQKGDDMDSSSSNSPVEVIGEGACTLCHKKGVELGHNYCINCSNYLNRFTPR